MKEARRKSLLSLEKLQQRRLDETRRSLADHMAAERRIEGRIAGLKAQMQENRLLVAAAREEAAHDLTLWNGYRHWLPVAQGELERLEDALAEAQERSESVRQTMRGQLREREVTATLLERASCAQKHRQMKEEQRVLDDHAGIRHGRGDVWGLW